jgi:glycosidase
MGTEEDLHELVDVAHKNNMNVLLDFVANHVHEDHPFYQANKDVATDLYLPDGRLNTELWDEQRLTTWFDVFLPSLRLDDPFVYETLTDSAVYWIKEYGLDGFRHDATKHVPEIFWRSLTRKIKDEVVIPEGREVYQIGETYGTRELVGSYVNAGQLDAQFDFNVYDACASALAKPDGSFDALNDAIQASLNMFGHHHLMGNITGNQDRGRFISYAGGALRFDEDAKKAGWTREVGVGDPVAYKKSALLIGLISTIPGLPVIYYGDEVGSYGGNDPDNRKMMFFEDLSEDESALLEQSQKILNFRKGCLPLIYGDMRIHHIDADTYAFSRNYFDQRVLVVFNKSNNGLSIAIDLDPDQDASNATSAFGTKIRGDGSSIKADLDANGFDIITLN